MARPAQEKLAKAPKPAKAADKLRKNIDAAEYKHVVLGLIFLKYISDAFEEQYALLAAGEGGALCCAEFVEARVGNAPNNNGANSRWRIKLRIMGRMQCAPTIITRSVIWHLTRIFTTANLSVCADTIIHNRARISSPYALTNANHYLATLLMA